MTRGIVVDPTAFDDPTAQSPPQGAPAPASTDDGLPEKFKGKSAKDIAASYAQLESELGRKNNELGEIRAEARTWRSLAEDLGTAQRTRAEAPKKEPVQISTDQLLAHPNDSVRAIVSDVLEQHLGHVVKTQNELSQSVEAAEFVRDYPNYLEVGNNPEFQKFVSANPRRLSAAREALEKKNVRAMRTLMEDWEERQQLVSQFTKSNEPKPPQVNGQQPTAPTGIDGARAVATERSGDSAPVVTGGKTWRQSEVIETMLRKPDLYYSAGYQAELMEAIKQGRLK